MVLMERAALALAEETARLGKKILAVCEGGNNGGDGVCCARILHEWGSQADVFYIGGLRKTSEAFRKQCEIAEKCGVKILYNSSVKVILRMIIKLIRKIIFTRNYLRLSMIMMRL